MTVGTEARKVGRLAIPLIATFLGTHSIGFVDTAIVGRLGETALGAVSLGNMIYITIGMVGLGIVSGMDPLVAQALGARELARARRIYTQGLWASGLVVLPLTLISLLSLWAIGQTQIDPETLEATRSYVLARLPGLLPLFAYMASRSYLQAQNRPGPLVVSVIVANMVNVPVTWVLVFGDSGLTRFGLPEIGLPSLGATGAGWTSTLCNGIQCWIVGRPAFTTPGPGRGGSLRWEIFSRIVRIGAPIGLIHFARVGLFGSASLIVAQFGAGPLAAHHVALTLMSFALQFPLGIGGAASVCVGLAVGVGDRERTRRAGFTALALGAGVTAGFTVVFLGAPALLARILTDVPEVIAASAPMVAIAGIFLVLDGAQTIAGGSLRGAGDTAFAGWANILGFGLVGLPIGSLLAFGFGLEARGIWLGLTAGVFIVATSLIWRFHSISNQTITRA